MNILENLSKTPAEFSFLGNYSDFSSPTAIKLKKNKTTFMQATVSHVFQSNSSVIFKILPTVNMGIPEGTLYYDGEDSEYIYYHIGNYGSNVDNSIFIIQSK